jgi:DNA topoisomerase-2
VTGGRNGFGAKLANIFSTKFEVETADSLNKKMYKQVWRNNMSIREEPVITENKKGEDYTCITFYPDLTRFGMERLDEDIISLLTKRVYDLAGVTPSTVKVRLNEKLINIQNFNTYCDLYLKCDDTRELPKIIEKPADTNSRWEIIASLSDG